MEPNIKPYKISVPDSQLSLLQKKLALATFPDELEDAGWDYGTPLGDIKRLVKYWKDGYNWRPEEAKLNKLPQFKTLIPVEGFGEIDIHFIHKPSSVEGAIPLLFVHGWPGSFLEATKLLPLLSDERNASPNFSVVIPSLPNYGFSGGVTKRGFGLAQYAEVMNKLMLKLGYQKYITQGGDWGMFITRTMGTLYPQHVKASHINMIRAQAPKFSTNPILAIQHAMIPYTQKEIEGFERTAWFSQEGVGYRVLQSTKPQTLGYGLADSPIAVLAWIYEKLHDWTDAYPWTDDEILTWVSIYCFSDAGPAASVRIYYETAHSTDFPMTKTEEWVKDVKLGFAIFPKELRVFPKIWAYTLGDVVYESEHDHGGHFAAWEHPDVIENDLRKMFGKGGGAFGAVKGKSGYA